MELFNEIENTIYWVSINIINKDNCCLLCMVYLN